jgi:exodeoxyribonuclease III
MKIATWNINSVRLRAPLAARFLREHAPDVLALQETKCPNDLFPVKEFARLGYEHQAVHGQKGYHGVAIVSRLPFVAQKVGDYCREGHCRHISVTFENGLELHDFYVPAGGDIPDPEQNPKFAHKIDFLQRLEQKFKKRKDGAKTPVMLVGDLNVAPLENDVWNHKQLLKVVSHTPIETSLLNAARAAFNWIDVTRQFVPASEKIFSWWSYRAADWEASDRGRRLDHIWASPALKGAIKNQAIIKKMRGWEKASDHVPIIAEIDV